MLTTAPSQLVERGVAGELRADVGGLGQAPHVHLGGRVERVRQRQDVGWQLVSADRVQGEVGRRHGGLGDREQRAHRLRGPVREEGRDERLPGRNDGACGDRSNGRPAACGRSGGRRKTMHSA